MFVYQGWKALLKTQVVLLVKKPFETLDSTDLQRFVEMKYTGANVQSPYATQSLMPSFYNWSAGLADVSNVYTCP